MVKIGMTTRTPEGRLAEITSVSGLLKPATVHYCVYVPDCRRAERFIHLQLDDCRASRRREFFKIDPDKAADIIDHCHPLAMQVVIRPPRRRYQRPSMLLVSFVITVATCIATVVIAWSSQ
jgi:T5orf172 domain